MRERNSLVPTLPSPRKSLGMRLMHEYLLTYVKHLPTLVTPLRWKQYLETSWGESGHTGWVGLYTPSFPVAKAEMGGDPTRWLSENVTFWSSLLDSVPTVSIEALTATSNTLCSKVLMVLSVVSLPWWTDWVEGWFHISTFEWEIVSLVPVTFV